MGDLALDTAVRSRGDGRFVASLSRDWEIWGPNGGYVAAVALRAAGAAAGDGTAGPSALRPAACSCHYLSVAEFGPVDLLVEVRRAGRTASSLRVEMTQGDRRILDAMVWTVAAAEGLEHDEAVMPDVPGPDALPARGDRVPGRYPFWRNVDARPVDGGGWPPPGPRPSEYQEWMRFLPTATFADPWVDAARAVVLIDVASWPSAHGPHAWQQPPYIAPTLDLNVAFHRPAPDAEWLLCDAAAPVSTGGLFGWTARVWSRPGGTGGAGAGGRLHASGGGQCLYRRLPG
jgi:acyl-CoA thioesterase-2